MKIYLIALSLLLIPLDFFSIALFLGKIYQQRYLGPSYDSDSAVFIPFLGKVFEPFLPLSINIALILSLLIVHGTLIYCIYIMDKIALVSD